MNWATSIIEQLQRGEKAMIRPRGTSMTGRIEDGERVTITPMADHELEVGEIVLAKCKGHVYLHLIKAQKGSQYLLGNNRGNLNGWIHRNAIFGYVDENALSV